MLSNSKHHKYRGKKLPNDYMDRSENTPEAKNTVEDDKSNMSLSEENKHHIDKSIIKNNSLNIEESNENSNSDREGNKKNIKPSSQTRKLSRRSKEKQYRELKITIFLAFLGITAAIIFSMNYDFDNITNDVSTMNSTGSNKDSENRLENLEKRVELLEKKLAN